MERKISLLRTVMGPVWPKDEWEGLVDRAAELTAAGKDQDTVKELVSVESTALKSALKVPCPPLCETMYWKPVWDWAG